MDLVVFEVINEISEHGRSRVEIKCASCSYVFCAYTWSLAGSGKRCPECKTMHYRTGADLTNIGSKTAQNATDQ